MYKKNYPPSLGDEVWRLERIGKDGAFHRKLAAEGIKNVQHFLKMYYKDEATLRKVCKPPQLTSIQVETDLDILVVQQVDDWLLISWVLNRSDSWCGNVG